MLDEHTRVPEILLASAEVLSGLDAADVEIIKQCAIETEAYEKQKWAEKEESAEKIVREAGCTITELTPEAYAEFQAAMTNPSDALGGKSLYEKYGADYHRRDRRCRRSLLIFKAKNAGGRPFGVAPFFLQTGLNENERPCYENEMQT